VTEVPDQEFGIEVPEADRLEQLREIAPPDGDPDGLPAVDAGTADPADVLEQRLEVPVEDDEDR
jgi:hypothetical protein